jgi:UDP-3-O-[3-hydroxymyristoyl] N-acetylglucosamine deacetylase
MHIHKEIMMQQTLAAPVHCEGISLHQGAVVHLTIKPAPEYHGIWFKRTDVSDPTQAMVKADYRFVSDTRLCTVLENPYGVKVSTVEHLMAALWGCGVDNALIEIDGAEVPIMDGSSEPFVFLIECAGVAAQEAPRRIITVKTPIVVQEGTSTAIIQASDDDGFSLDVEIDFPHAAIGQQRYSFVASDMGFRQSISRARTFGFLKDVEALRSVGLARGGSLANAVVINDDGIMNEDGLRHHDEFARHKALDCIGDYFLAGHRLNAHAKVSRPGHAINNKLMKALFATPDAWHYSETSDMVIPSAHVVAAAAKTNTARMAG